MNNNLEYLKHIATFLTLSHRLITVAESCTGGLLSAALTTLPGSSEWFDRGFITYSNAAKKELLGVSEDILVHYGAVSEETAKAMAKGALQNSHSHIALAITGIAGPDGGSVEKPVGTVWFGLADKYGVSQVTLQIFSGTRDSIREQAVSFALHWLSAYFLEEKK